MGNYIDIAKSILIIVVTYILPIVSFIFSVFVFVKSRRINKIEEKIKQYELDKIEQEKRIEPKANIEARITKISSGNYRIKVWNSGNATAYNVDYDIPSECRILLHKQITPFEVLEPDEYFEELIILTTSSNRKYKVITKWNDQAGNECSHEKIRSI